MAKKITYGPIGTTLIQVGTDFYLGYEYDGEIYYWSIEEKDIPALSEIDTVRYDQNGIFANPIEGFQYMPVTDWSDLIEEKKVINAGSLTDLQDSDMSIDSMINKIVERESTLPWTKEDTYKDYVTELIIEDPTNWLVNLDADIDGKLFGESGLITGLGYSKNMYNQAITYANDPIGKKELVTDKIVAVKNVLASLEANLDDKTIEWVANKLASAAWSATRTTAELTAATQEGYNYPISSDFEKVLNNSVVTQSNLGVDTIQQLLDNYLPKELHKPYLDRINAEAGKLINDATYEDTFIEKLKNERFAFNSSWDKEIAWSSILQNGMTLAQSVWGIVPESDDAGLYDMLQTNDINKQKEIARQIGLDRGYQKTSSDLFDSLNVSMGGNVVRTQDYNIRQGVNNG